MARRPSSSITFPHAAWVIQSSSRSVRPTRLSKAKRQSSLEVRGARREAEGMLRIRSEQLEVFEQASLKAFEDNMVDYLRDFSPKHAQILDEEQLRAVVRYGIDRAEHHGLTSERSTRIYTE